MTNRGLGALAVIIGATLSISGCVGSEVSQEQVAGATPTVEVMTQEEMIEKIKLLPTVPELAGECLGPAGEGSKKLLAYVHIAAMFASVPHEEIVELHKAVRQVSDTSVRGDVHKLYVLNRLMYDVPSALAYDSDNDDMWASRWRHSPMSESDINYLYPLEIRSTNKICIASEPINDPPGSYYFLDRSHLELSFFEMSFPKRDLSVYLEE